jgi:hypothetical protein
MRCVSVIRLHRINIPSTSHQHAIVISLSAARIAAESFIAHVDFFTCVALGIS